MNTDRKEADAINPSDSPVPNVVYKYLSVEGGLASLRNMTIKFSRLSDFNDPFECRTRGIVQADKEDLITTALESVQNEDLFKEFCESLPFPKMDELFERRSSVLSGELNIVKFFSDIFANAEKRIKWHLPESISNRMGIACFSSCFDSILMWSHYTKDEKKRDHRGIVIGYKTNRLPKLNPVTYSKERVSIPFGPGHSTKWVKDLGCTKFEGWAYEREWRSFAWRSLSEMNSEDSLLLKMEPEDIVDIRMGIHINESLRQECLAFTHSHASCKLYQAYCHPTEFELEFDCVDA